MGNNVSTENSICLRLPAKKVEGQQFLIKLRMSSKH